MWNSGYKHVGFDLGPIQLCNNPIILAVRMYSQQLATHSSDQDCVAFKLILFSIIE